uniref:DNA-directed RNA polymerase subunit alpha n=12 Tax=Araucaria TaxID=25666 RepID=A0A0B5H6G4_9CONI|nr:RNA polymerase alpha chain [Araucaria muelleri]AJF42007.1 RNA polymerase alpha chain [Araucaria scopulorum]AJF42171.1 RNA polymerase alpha chain [Araucaria bernieri]AJF42330.1 RNA polymerase alpha chain [Araucaria subulata]AJF42654.1 RNA polymerase alpha chain [Araucaria columnaris]AJF42737.1 RNA polymerase alpha chain [Araucaria humboldtensis]AJF42818.1 RNA polymerase alpha chain [Araucaria biramulata]AJF43388.1 RNA polymerase alpha chain [Araucaria montana]AJF43551.1 RNA polymerase alp
MIQDEISVSLKRPQWKCVESREDSKRLHYGRFILYPLCKGQANTIGIGMRRALLGEVEGTCITRAKFKNITHEYSAIIGIEESVHDILMNLKEIVLRSDPYGIREASLYIVGPKNVTAQDIILPPSAKIIDTTQHIANINKSITLDIKLQIEKGRGYILQNPKNYNSKDGIFPIDAVFMPVRSVNYSIHSYWTGNEIKEIIFIEIWTNGGLTPREALYEASRNLIELFLPFLSAEEQSIDGTNNQNDNMPPSLPLLYISTDMGRTKKGVEFKHIFIDQLELPPRVYNCLRKANINTLSDLLNYSREDLMRIERLGEQSVEQILTVINNFAIDLPRNRF